MLELFPPWTRSHLRRKVLAWNAPAVLVVGEGAGRRRPRRRPPPQGLKSPIGPIVVRKPRWRGLVAPPREQPALCRPAPGPLDPTSPQVYPMRTNGTYD